MKASDGVHLYFASSMLSPSEKPNNESLSRSTKDRRCGAPAAQPDKILLHNHSSSPKKSLTLQPLFKISLKICGCWLLREDCPHQISDQKLTNDPSPIRKRTPQLNMTRVPTTLRHHCE